MANTTENKAVKLTRKQIRDAVKKKQRTKNTIKKVIITTVISVLIVAILGTCIFFSTYDPLGINIKGTLNAMFSLPYEGYGHEDITGERNIFPLDQAAYFYFLNNYPEYVNEEFCMQVKDDIEYWNVWNKQSGYKVVPAEFVYVKSSESMGYFELLVDINTNEGEFKTSALISGTFGFDKDTNLISKVKIDTSSLLNLSEVYDKVVLGIEKDTEADSSTSSAE